MRQQPKRRRSRSASSTNVDDFDFGDLWGRVTVERAPVDLEETVRRLVDPACSIETLHWGRNYLYVAEVDDGAGNREVVVKQFRNQGWVRWLKRRLRGSKAERSWQCAWALRKAGLNTPSPMLLVESSASEGPSFFVSERLDGFFESRYFFRAVREGREGELFPEVDKAELLEALGQTARRLHDAGIWYRDFSIGNLLVRLEGKALQPTVYLVDTNRARLGQRLGLWRRTRDICRLPIVEPSNQESFLSGYWGQESAGSGAKRLLFSSFVHVFLVRNQAKEILRRPIRSLRARFRPSHPHIHIAPIPEGASSRDKIVWDELSDQPHQHAGRLDRARVRLTDLSTHVEAAWAGVKAAPKIRTHYHQLRRALYKQPIPAGKVGLAMRPHEHPDDQLDAVRELGVGHVLLRLHPWDNEHTAEEDLARELHQAGLEVMFALPQNRELVRDPSRWREAIGELAERFTPYGSTFQIGQAINRSKWGVWSYREYLELAGEANEILSAHKGVRIVGPAVIDFEPHALASVLNMRAVDFRFHAATNLLYVDRRGAPENRQIGFDTVGKVVLMRAIAATSANAEDRLWITEVNWPLWEGPHSPAGKSVAVDEETQADFLVRYYLLVLATGLVERIYWWRLVARGYGLMDPAEDRRPRRRPSFRALATLQSQLSESTFVGPLPVPAPAHAYLIRRSDGTEFVAAWSAGPALTIDLPRPAVEVTSRDGEATALDRSLHARLSSSPVYFRLSANA